jgi:small subunit ribosomal protein S3
MGHKVNPIGIRLGIVKKSESIWFATAKNYSIMLLEDLNIRTYLEKKLHQSYIDSIKIQRTSQNLIITIYSARPGVIIGKKGEEIEKLKINLIKVIKPKIPLTINIEEIKKPELSATIVANLIAFQLQKRIMFRKAIKKSGYHALRLGAKGIKICISGRIGGAEIARSEWYRKGSVPLHTLRANIDYNCAMAKTAYGIIGVKVWIYVEEDLKENLNVATKTH